MRTLFLSSCILFFTTFSTGTTIKTSSSSSPTSANYHITVIDINNFVTKLRNDGFFTKDSLYYYCMENGAFPIPWTAIYTEGFIWGGLVRDGRPEPLAVGGSTYRCGLTPGAIIGLATGEREDPSSPALHVWRVRRDWQSADFSEEADASYSLDPDQIRQQYMNDWNAWPAAKGAPFDDVNNDGIYDPEIDIPGVPGADQTLWLVANDLDGVVTQKFYGSQPIGLEEQLTLWGYQKGPDNPFSDMTFRRLRLIYKGTAYTPLDAKIDDMYLCQWSDPDIWSAWENQAGCDSALNLVYAHQRFAYPNLTAIGYILLAGPLVPSLKDIAQFDFKDKYEFKNLPVSSAIITASGNDPEFDNYVGSIQWYNLLGGRQSNGLPWIDPNNQTETKYPYSGDPATGMGWVDTLFQDRRVGINSGPFTMALGDTQDIITAVIGDNFVRQGITERAGYSRSVKYLKYKARAIKDFLKNRSAIYVRVDTLAENDLVRVGQTVNLSAYTLLFQPEDQIASIDWSLEFKPPGSLTTMQAMTGSYSAFTPDLPGKYHIQTSLSTVQGYSPAFDIVIDASDNKPPDIDITLSSHEIIYGDSVLIDASGTIDPEHDDLSFLLSGGSYFYPGANNHYDQKNPRKLIQPITTGFLPVKVMVDDGHFSYSKSDTIFVYPKTDRVSIRYTYVDSVWQAAGDSWDTYMQFSFCQDTLLACLQETGDGRIFAYRIFPDAIRAAAQLQIENVSQIIYLKDNILILKMQGPEYRFQGPVSIYRVSANWQLTPLLLDYRPGNYDVISTKFIDDEFYVRCAGGPHYKIDFLTYPSNPRILASSNELGNFYFINGKFLLQTSSFSHKIYDRQTLLPVGELILKNLDNYYKVWGAQGNLIFVSETEFSSTLFLYDISDIDNPEMVCQIPVTYTPVTGWMDEHYIRRVQYINNNVIAVYITGGILLYDITIPARPIQKGAFFAGFASSIGHVSITENNGQYFIHGWSRFLKQCIYSGVNGVDLKFLTIENNNHFINTFQLDQNYPNPFNSATKIRFYLPHAGDVKLDIFNIIGQKIKTLLDQYMPGGVHEINLNAATFASAVYFYRIQTGDFHDVKKMVLLR